MRRALLTLLPLLAGLMAGASHAGPPGPYFGNATGEGTSGAHTFSFTAQLSKAGQATGQARFQTIARPGKIYRIKVTCLRMAANTATATVGGSLVGVSPSARLRGANFQVFDGDVRGEPGQDRISGIVRLRAVPRTCPAPNASRLRYAVQGQITVMGVLPR